MCRSITNLGLKLPMPKLCCLFSWFQQTSSRHVNLFCQWGVWPSLPYYCKNKTRKLTSNTSIIGKYNFLDCNAPFNRIQAESSKVLILLSDQVFFWVQWLRHFTRSVCELILDCALFVQSNDDFWVGDEDCGQGQSIVLCLELYWLFHPVSC